MKYFIIFGYKKEKKNGMDNNLIFDLGFYKGESSTKYLIEGFKVIGVDCNPLLKNNLKFYQWIKTKKLIIEKKCISEKDGEIINFYVQPQKIVWSSTNKNIAERLEESQCYEVETITLSSLIEKYGVPIYCKIDIEGNDSIALKSLFNVEEKPLYISCETECIGNENPYEIDGLENIHILKELGYNKFFLKNQHNDFLFHFELNKEYEWKTYEEICEELKNERQNHDFTEPYSFWWDVYATF